MAILLENIMNPARVIELGFRHKKKILVLPLGALLLATAVILFAPRTYRSEAKLFLQVGRESVGVNPEAAIGGTFGLQQLNRESEVKSAKEILQNRSISALVVDKLTPEVVLYGRPAKGEAEPNFIIQAAKSVIGFPFKVLKNIDPVSERERAVILLQKKFKLHSERNSTVILVWYEAKTPQLAQEVLQEIITQFRLEYTRIYRNVGSQNFFKEQRDSWKLELASAENHLRDSKNIMGLASIQGRRATLENQLRLVEEQRFSVNQDLVAAQSSITQLASLIKVQPKRIPTTKRQVPNDGVDLMREQLYTLQVSQSALKSKYRDSHPQVQAITAQVQEAKRILDEQDLTRTEVSEDLNEVRQQLVIEQKQKQTLLVGLQARTNLLKAQRLEVVSEIKNLNHNEVKIEEMTRTVNLARSKYLKYEESYEQGRINRELQTNKISSISEAQSPTLQEKPVSPNKLLVLIAALFMGTSATVGLILLSEKTNSTLRSEEELTMAAGVPVFGSVSKKENAKDLIQS